MILNVFSSATRLRPFPRGESLQSFCFRHKVPYNFFHKWYKDTRHQLVPVQVEGRPASAFEPDSDSSIPQGVSQVLDSHPLQIRIDIRMSTGIHIHQKNLSYPGLKALVEKLEVLC